MPTRYLPTRVDPQTSAPPAAPRSGRVSEFTARAPEASTEYLRAVSSLGGLSLSGSTTSLLRNNQSKRRALVNSVSQPTLPSFFDETRATFVVKTPRGSAPKDEEHVKLPPLKLTLKAARSVAGLPLPGRGEASSDESADEDLEEDEDKEQVDALRRFNKRHAMCSKSARDLLSALERSENRGKGKLGTSFDTAIGEVFRNRFAVAEDYQPLTVSPPRKKRRPRRKRWRLDESSIWIGRKLRGNSLDFYETPESLRSLFDTDWVIARSALARMVERGTSWMDADGNGIHDSIDEAGNALWKHAHLIYGCFDYYSCVLDQTLARAMAAQTRDPEAEVDVFDMTYNAFHEFARDCRLISSSCSKKTIDVVWATVNALSHDEAIRELDRWNHRRMMCRHEFLQAVVRLAAAIYLETGVECELSLAVDRLCGNLCTVLPPEALQDSNAFRKAQCYTELTDKELRQHQASLRAIFDVYARSNRNKGDILQDDKLISIGEWLNMLMHVGLLETGQVSFFGAKMIFKWSLIRACHDHSAKSERRLRNMTFSDFCEGLVRIARIIALPTDDEIEACGAKDAGEFTLALWDAGDGSLDAFIKQRKVGWRDQPRQHVSRCVHHLISLLERTIKQDVASNTMVGAGETARPAPVSETEAARFEERRRSGCTLSHVLSDASLRDGVRASASIVRDKLLQTLHGIDIFCQLDHGQLETLCDAMSQARYDQWTFVFEQGDEGDSFYIITEGEAVVVRTEPGSEEEKELGTLTTGAYFGERALLKNQVRFAGIQATSTSLHAVYITRDNFERALGAPLDRMVPDQYRAEEVELINRLAAVPLLQKLTNEQLKLVVNRFTEVKVPQGFEVVTQGQPGNTFFIITRGTADVLRYPTAEGAEAATSADEAERLGKPELLTQLSAWHAFGERALMKNETRYATVRVTSEEMHVMCISRDIFEEALGVKLGGVLTRQDSKIKMRRDSSAFAVTRSAAKTKGSSSGDKKSTSGRIGKA